METLKIPIKITSVEGVKSDIKALYSTDLITADWLRPLIKASISPSIKDQLGCTHCDPSNFLERRVPQKGNIGINWRPTKGTNTASLYLTCPILTSVSGSGQPPCEHVKEITIFRRKAK